MQKQNYMNQANIEYIEQMYQQFRQNPEAVDHQWKMFFEGVEFAQTLPPSESGGKSVSGKDFDVSKLIKAYRDYGHLKADLDPLKLQKKDTDFFQLKNYNLSDSDLETEFPVSKYMNIHLTKLKDIVQHLENSYCGTITAQLSECRAEVRDWFRAEFEQNQGNFHLSKDEKKAIFQQLARTESLEKFIHTRYVGTKRFSIEGGDSLIPMLENLVQRGTSQKLEEIVIGMAHRGRINVLANFMGKALETILSEFDGTAFKELDHEGDVKYHLGFSADKETPNGPCHVSLAFNPSHLEAVNPVVLGMTRAKQRQRKDTGERKKVLPVIIHGDAAFAGQGVVSETLQLSKLKGYTVGGSIHVIVNNQVGFTTNPDDARSTIYSSDMAMAIKAPVILVNGDDVEACVRAMDMAFRFRQQFGEDVVIDLICYRRFGHNEGDEPAFTQPKMYDIIKKHPTPMKIYEKKVVDQKVISADEAKSFYQQKIDNLQKILDEVREKPPQITPPAFGGMWKGLRKGTLEDFEKSVSTKASSEDFNKAAHILTTEPTKIEVHKKIQKLIEQRAKMIEDNAIDWGLGELLAYGTLNLEGTSVRLTGQDVSRGTFTHRHAVYFDAKTGEGYSPLKNLIPEKSEFCIYNSPLSEFAVLGFEYGNACSDPTFLTLWEAQFGDFANGAQIIIDQFLSSGEEKWIRGCGLVLLLPHGYEGQGPEHSSARLERFLQMCAQANMQVCNLTTPANLFHALRRQVKRDFRKPLVIMSPKSLLRHPKVVSPVSHFTEGKFEEVISDPTVTDMSQVEKIILCTGKLYYDLDKAREESGTNNGKTAIFRVEQIYPFPRTQLAPYLAGMPKLKKVVWAQEEPQNMGSWLFIQPFINDLLSEVGQKTLQVEYVGRAPKASPATGSPSAHAREQQNIIYQCLKA